MSGEILIGRGKHMTKMSRQILEKDLAGAPERIGARLGFMTEEHHLVRNFVVKELPQIGAPIPPERLSRDLNLSVARISEILRELESHLFFLVRDDQGAVSWAFPVTVNNTGHRLNFSTGERLDAA